jgi:hypothetical protein
MDFNLPEADLRRWARQLDRHFNNLHDVAEEFAPGSMSAQVRQKK